MNLSISSQSQNKTKWNGRYMYARYTFKNSVRRSLIITVPSWESKWEIATTVHTDATVVLIHTIQVFLFYAERTMGG